MSDKVNFAAATLPCSPAADLENDLIGSLKDSQEYFRTLVDLLPICLMVHRDGKMVYVNPGLLHLSGYHQAGELVGKPLLALVPPDGHMAVQKRIEKITHQGGFYNPPLEQVIVKKDGEKIFVEIEAIAVVHCGLPAVMAIFRDITPRKKTEEALRKSEENFQKIIHDMPQGIMLVTQDHVLFVNRAFMNILGYSSPKEIVGLRPFDLIQPEFHEVVRERIGNVIEKGLADPLIKVKFTGKDGNPVNVESSSISIRFFGEAAAMVLVRDITAQDKLEHQAVINEKLATVGTLAAGVAHEINNPLAYVLGNLVFLKEQFVELKMRLRKSGGEDDFCANLLSEMSDELGDIAAGGERIREIVKGLKAFVHSHKDEAEKVNLNQVIESAVNMTFHVIKQKARLEKDLAVDLPVLTADPGKLQQVFINLLVNAAQSIEGNHPAQNKISVRTGREDGHLFVEITDTGRGIPENVLPRIFDPFYTTKAAGEGTGLGLSVCNEIIQDYRGTIRVQSRAGKGATFIVRLPLENGRQAAETGLDFLPETKQGRVLVVDDEPGNLELLNRMLKKECKVLSAFSGAEAMAVLEKEGGRVDAVVTDVNMPDMSGIGLYKAAAEKFPQLGEKFVFITGGIFDEETKEFFRTVSNPCLEKPFTRENLFKAIAPWIGSPIKKEKT